MSDNVSPPPAATRGDGVSPRPPAACPSPIRAVLFDAVGTLFHSQPSITRVYADAGARAGIVLSESEIGDRFLAAFRRHFGRPAAGSPAELTRTSEDIERERWRRIVAEVFVELPEASGALFETLWEHFARGSSWRLFDDVAPTWEALAKRGLRIGIASNYDRRLLSVVSELRPLADCRHVYHSAGVGHAKPGVAFFRAIELDLGLSPDELLFVGDDRVNDYEGAAHAGWHSVWLGRQRPPEGPHHIQSLLELLDKLNPRHSPPPAGDSNASSVAPP
jgi:putative hydrolase of the HAD superfamily